MGRKTRNKIKLFQKKKQKKEKQKESTAVTVVEKKDDKPKYYVYGKCHTGFHKVAEHLYVGRERDLNSEFLKSIDCLVPLNDLDGDIWKKGYRNDIMYLPISDYSILPKDVELTYVGKILDYINQGKNVAIFCMGGHGRTGYIASLVLFELGYKNPIHHLRTTYCDEAVESRAQLRAIAEYCGDDTLFDLYEDTLFTPYVYNKASNYQSRVIRPYSSYAEACWGEEPEFTSAEDDKKKNYMAMIESIFTKSNDDAFTTLMDGKTCGDCGLCINSVCCNLDSEYCGDERGYADRACLEISA